MNDTSGTRYDALNPTQVREAQLMANLAIREYFDVYLTQVFPGQVAALIAAHDTDCGAHGGVERKFSRLIWMIAGASAVGGGGIATAIQFFMGGCPG